MARNRTLYLLQQTAIAIIDPDSGAKSTLPLDLDEWVSPRCLALDDAWIYVGTSAGAVVRMPVSGGTLSTVHSGQNDWSALWCELHLESERLYFLDRSQQTLWLVADGSSTELATGVGQFEVESGVVYSLTRGLLAALWPDGSQTTLVSFGLRRHDVLWLSDERLYFHGSHAPIERVAVAGGDTEAVVDDAAFAQVGDYEFQIAIADDTIFVSSGAGELWRVTLDDSLPRPIDRAESRGPFDEDDYQPHMAIDDRYVYWYAGNQASRIDADKPITLFATCRDDE